MSEDVSSRLAYDETVRALRAQADAHGGLRQRAATVLATSMVVTSFFGGQAVARNATPSESGWLAVVAFAVAGLLSIAVLFPGDLRFSADLEAVVGLLERGQSERDPHRELALALSSRYGVNDRRIARLQWIFRAAAVALLVEALLWIVFLAQT